MTKLHISKSGAIQQHVPPDMMQYEVHNISEVFLPILESENPIKPLDLALHRSQGIKEKEKHINNPMSK